MLGNGRSGANAVAPGDVERRLLRLPPGPTYARLGSLPATTRSGRNTSLDVFVGVLIAPRLGDHLLSCLLDLSIRPAERIRLRDMSASARPLPRSHHRTRCHGKLNETELA